MFSTIPVTYVLNVCCCCCCFVSFMVIFYSESHLVTTYNNENPDLSHACGYLFHKVKRTKRFVWPHILEVGRAPSPPVDSKPTPASPASYLLRHKCQQRRYSGWAWGLDSMAPVRRPIFLHMEFVHEHSQESE